MTLPLRKVEISQNFVAFSEYMNFTNPAFFAPVNVEYNLTKVAHIYFIEITVLDL